MLGHLHDQGLGVPKDLVKGLELARKACAAGEPSGCHNVAFHLAAGDAGPQDVEEARRLYDRACKAGLQPSCAALAKLAAPDPLAPVIAAIDARDHAGAAKLAKPLCDRGDMDGCAWLALARWELGQRKDALALWERACTANVAWACREAAGVYWLGEVGKANAARALTLGVKGCDLDDGDACMLVGQWSDQVEDVPAGAPAVIGFTASIVWAQRACRLRSPGGCKDALVMLRAQLRDPAGSRDALELAQIACDELHDGAICVELADAYCKGDGVPRDDAQCRRYRALACQHGVPSACGAP